MTVFDPVFYPKNKKSLIIRIFPVYLVPSKTPTNPLLAGWLQGRRIENPDSFAVTQYGLQPISAKSEGRLYPDMTAHLFIKFLPRIGVPGRGEENDS